MELISRIKIFRYSTDGKEMENKVNDFLTDLYNANKKVRSITTCTAAWQDMWDEVVTVHYEYIPKAEELLTDEKVVG